MIIDSPGRREQLAAVAERLPAHVYELVTDHRLTLAATPTSLPSWKAEPRDYYCLNDYLVIATGGSSGVRGVFPWSWEEFIEIACVTFRYQLRDEPPERLTGRRLLAVIETSQTAHRSPFLFSVSRLLSDQQNYLYREASFQIAGEG